MTKIAPLAEFYRQRSVEPGRRKGARTRDALKAAAAKLLEKTGYLELRVADINELAGVSNALFYVYFRNKTEITHEILADFLNVFESALHSPTPARTNYQSIYWGTLAYTERFAAQPGLMRCLLQFGDEVPAFSALWRRWNHRWIERVARSLRGRAPELAASAVQLRLKIGIVGAMVDGFLRTLYVERDPLIGLWAAEAAPGAPQIAELLSVLWYRAIFGADPIADDLAATRGAGITAVLRPSARRRPKARAGRRP